MTTDKELEDYKVCYRKIVDELGGLWYDRPEQKENILKYLRELEQQAVKEGYKKGYDDGYEKAFDLIYKEIIRLKKTSGVNK